MNIREINVIGAGSLGSAVVQILAKMSPNWHCPISVWDFDRVEEHNANNQIYTSGDVGELKVVALSRIISGLGGPKIRSMDAVVDEKTDLRGLVILAVDTMSVRKKIFDACKYNWGVDYLIDARMGGHLGMIFALDPKNQECVDRYDQWFYDDKDVATVVCTTNETIPALWTVAASIAKIVLLYRRTEVLVNTYIEGAVNLHECPVVIFEQYALI